MTREHPRGNSGNLGAPHRRSLVVVDQPACFILCGPATWYAAALSSRGVVFALGRSQSDRYSGHPPRRHLLHRTGHPAPLDLFECGAQVSDA